MTWGWGGGRNQKNFQEKKEKNKSFKDFIKNKRPTKIYQGKSYPQFPKKRGLWMTPKTGIELLSRQVSMALIFSTKKREDQNVNTKYRYVHPNPFFQS